MLRYNRFAKVFKLATGLDIIQNSDRGTKNFREFKVLSVMVNNRIIAVMEYMGRNFPLPKRIVRIASEIRQEFGADGVIYFPDTLTNHDAQELILCGQAFVTYDGQFYLP